MKELGATEQNTWFKLLSFWRKQCAKFYKPLWRFRLLSFWPTDWSHWLIQLNLTGCLSVKRASSHLFMHCNVRVWPRTFSTVEKVRALQITTFIIFYFPFFLTYLSILASLSHFVRRSSLVFCCGNTLSTNWDTLRLVFLQWSRPAAAGVSLASSAIRFTYVQPFRWNELKIPLLQPLENWNS